MEKQPTSLFLVWQVRSADFTNDLLRAPFDDEEAAVAYARHLLAKHNQPVYVEHIYAGTDRTVATTFVEFVYDSRN